MKVTDFEKSPSGRLVTAFMVRERDRGGIERVEYAAFVPHPLPTDFNDQYYSAWFEVSRRGAWNEWVEFFLRGVSEQARDSLVRATRLLSLQDEWRRLAPSIGSSGNLIRLVDSLFDTPVLTVRDAAETLGITYHAARNNIRLLVEAELLREVIAGHPKLYVSLPIIRAIDSPITSLE